jgi:two-component system response regulator DegU
MIRVLIVDDHQLMRQGMIALLAKAKDIEIVGEGRDGQEAIALTNSLHPDVVLMDIEMPHLDGLRATHQLTAMQSKAKIAIVSMRSDENVAKQARQSGAKGYLVKNSSREQLIEAIRSINNGNSVCSPEVTQFFSSEEPGS